MASNEIIRYGPPNDMDKLPYGTRIKVHKEREQYDLYIQSNKDQDNPLWILMSTFDNHVEYSGPD